MKIYHAIRDIHLVVLNTFTISLLIASSVAEAQDRWSVEVRHGVSQAEKFGDADLKTGFGFEGMLAYRFLPRLGSYAGWSWHRLSADQSFVGPQTVFKETGYSYGIQYFYPMGTSKLSILWRAGGLWNHIEAENNKGEIIADSRHGLGWQGEAGLVFPLGKQWQVLPSIRYRSLSRDLKIGSETTEVNLNYVSLGVGFARLF